jgi:hypothetical protein
MVSIIIYHALSITTHICWLFTPTCFDVFNTIFRGIYFYVTKHKIRYPEDEIVHVRTCRVTTRRNCVAVDGIEKLQ